MRALAELRYHVFVEELGRHYQPQHVVLRQLLDDIDRDSINFAFFVNNTLVGGVRITPLMRQMKYDPHFAERYGVGNDSRRAPRGVYASRLVLLRTFRRRKELAFFLFRVYEHLLARGVRCIYLNTCARLVRLYMRFGFRPTGQTFFLHEASERVIPMAAELDMAFLGRVTSRLFHDYAGTLSRRG